MEAAEEFAGAGDAEAVGQQQRIVVVEVVERGVELAITFELRRVAFVDAGQIESAGFVEQPRLAGQPLGARGLRPQRERRGREAGNVGRQEEEDEGRCGDVVVTSGAACGEECDGCGHDRAADDEVDAPVGQTVVADALHDAGPEEHERRQREDADAVEKPVVAPPHDEFLQCLDREQGHREAEDQIGDAPFGQRPREEDLQAVEVEDRRVDEQRRRENPVEQRVGRFRALRFIRQVAVESCQCGQGPEQCPREEDDVGVDEITDFP